MLSHALKQLCGEAVRVVLAAWMQGVVQDGIESRTHRELRKDPNSLVTVTQSDITIRN